MGPHITWFDFLPGYHTLHENLQHYLGREWTWQMFQATHFQLDHIFGGILVLLFLAYGAVRYAAKVNRAADAGLVPPARFGMRNLFEMLSDTIFNLMVSVMGEKEARRYLPLVGTPGSQVLTAECSAGFLMRSLHLVHTRRVMENPSLTWAKAR